MAKSIYEARRAAAERLDQQVDTATREPYDHDDQPHWAKIADSRALRGIPALSRHGGTSAIRGTQPGENLGLFDDEE